MFYLVTEQYMLGSMAELQKWAYELHSSFLVPESPACVPGTPDYVVHEIDGVLAKDFDNEALMRRLFWKARTLARKQLKEELSMFRERRALGMGTFVGPPDAVLRSCVTNRQKELAVVDDYLIPELERLA